MIPQDERADKNFRAPLLHSLQASSKPAARGRVKKITRTFGENFWRRNHQCARKMGQAFFSCAAKRFHRTYTSQPACRAKTCCALKRWDGSFTLSLFFARKSPGSTFEVSLQPVRTLVAKNCAIKSPRKTIGIKWPSPDLYRDKLARQDISRDSLASRSSQSLLSRQSSRKADPSYLLKNQNSVCRGSRLHLTLVSGITGGWRGEERSDQGGETVKGRRVNDLGQDRIKILLILSCIGTTLRSGLPFPLPHPL